MKRMALLLVIIMMIGSLVGCAFVKGQEPTLDGVKDVCNLATFDCYYNNVVKDIKQGEGITGFLEKDRKYWVEYTGIAKMGVDLEQVKMEIKDTKVEIYVPKGQLLGEPVIPDGSILDEDIKIQKDGVIFKNPVTADFQSALLKEALVHLKETASNDTRMLDLARNRAKDLIETYITSLGDMAGVEYEIVWVDSEGKPE